MKIILYLNFLFWGSGFLYAFFFFIAYNGLGNIFEYKQAHILYLSADTSIMPAKIVYKYTVGDKEFSSYQNVSTETAETADIHHVKIMYNTTFSNLSIIKGLTGRETKVWDYAVGMIIFGFFFLIMFVIYKFSDHQKWEKVYTKGEYKSSRE